MRTGIIVCFICFFTINVSFSQVSEAEEDTTKQKVTFTPELSSFIEWNKVINQNAFIAAEVGVSLNEKVVLGLHGSYFLGDLIKRVVFPNFYYLDKYMWGPYLGYHFDLSDKFVVTPQVKYSFSYMRWTEYESERYYMDDHYIEIRPELVLNYYLLKTLNLRGGVGFTFVEGLGLSGISEENVDGLSLSLGVGIMINKN